MSELDERDRFIKEHYTSMSMQEMADHLGISKSTVSRRAKAMRESGEIDDAMAKAAERETQRARDCIAGCALGNAERLEMLDALKARLEDELRMTGGANLARVSSEYRKTLEEMAAISTNLDIVRDHGAKIDEVGAINLKRDMRSRFEAYGREELDCIVDEVLCFLDGQGLVRYTPLTRVKAEAAMKREEKAARMREDAGPDPIG